MEQFILLQGVYEENWPLIKYMFSELGYSMEDFKTIQSEFPTYLKIQGEEPNDVFIRQEAYEFFNTSKVDIEALALEMRALFPAGVKTGGYSVKSHPRTIEVKLKKFLKEYPKFTKQNILDATTNYINDRRKYNWAYMKAIHYYISKDGISTLAADCLALSDSHEVEHNAFETQV